MNRLSIVFYGVVIVILLITVRLFQLMVLKPYSDINPSSRVKTIKEQPSRGKILDNSGTILATNELSYVMFANPKHITDPYVVSKRISDAIHIDSASIEAKLRQDKQWVPLVYGVDKKDRDTIINLNINGIGFDEGYKRLYKEASLSAHILGFIGKDEQGEDVGYYGVEGFYDKELKGLIGRNSMERDVYGRPLLFGVQDNVKAIEGSTLTLTLDVALQQKTKSKLLEGMSRYGAKKGCIVVTDPNTNAILSLSCLPDFDQREYYKYPSEYYRNPIVQDTYEPGSTFKPLVVAAGIESKSIAVNDTVEELGPVKVSGYEIDNWNGKTEGTISITRVLEKSSNIGMVEIGKRIGGPKLVEYLQKYGFGDKTGVDLQGEAKAPLRSVWRELEYATATFGQGIAVTPIQLISAFNSIINGGNLYSPRIVKSIESDGKVLEKKPILMRRTVSESTSAIMRSMLESVVEHGEYRYKKAAGFRFGGKTGTAQIARNGVYDDEKTIASFVGFFPAQNPKYSILVLLWEPSAAIYGSETAAPLFFELSQDIINVYGLTPNDK